MAPVGGGYTHSAETVGGEDVDSSGWSECWGPGVFAAVSEDTGTHPAVPARTGSKVSRGSQRER